MILDLEHRPRIGPYILTRDLSPTTAFGGTAVSSADGTPATSQRHQPDRFLALHEDNQTSHIAYRFQPARGKAEEARLAAAVEAASLFEHPHALKIQQFTFDIAGQAWVVTPYAGDADGLRTLSRLLKEKGGQMRSDEAERALCQILEVVALAHGGGGLEVPVGGPARAVPCHGPLRMDEILVDRRGSLLVELYGLARAMETTSRPTLETLRDEVRSVVEIGYQLITGLRAEHPLIPAGRLVRKLDDAWDQWLARGLDPSGGFDSAEAALAALPGARPSVEVSVSAKGVLSRLRPTATLGQTYRA